jgi:hypothetical protein
VALDVDVADELGVTVLVKEGPGVSVLVLV